MAFVVVASLLLDQKKEEKHVPDACPNFGIKDEGACRFLCGVMANLAHHRQFLENEDFNRRGYTFDMIAVVDESFSDDMIDAIHSMGVQTLRIDISIKKLLAKSMHWSSPTKFVGIFRAQLFAEVLKPGALALIEHDAVMHADVDQYITNTTMLADELDFYFDHDDMELIAMMNIDSPMNAGHWVANPSVSAVRAWIQDLAGGFSKKGGWGHAGSVVPTLTKKTKIEDDGYNIAPGKWDFLGGNRDQGLFYHIFGLQRNTYYAWGRVANIIGKHGLDEYNVHILEDFPRLDDLGLYHFTGSDRKPWASNACKVGTLMNTEESLCRYEWASRYVDVIPKVHDELVKVKNSDFMHSYCAPILMETKEHCSKVCN